MKNEKGMAAILHSGSGKFIWFVILFNCYFNTVSLGQEFDSLAALVKVIQKGSSDSVRFDANHKFIIAFERLLNENGSFYRNFDSLKNVSVIMPADKKFRIYTWVLPHYDGSAYDYFGYLQYKNNDSILLTPLFDSTAVIKKPESEKLFPNKWFGAVYYAVEPAEKSGTTYYSLFG